MMKLKKEKILVSFLVITLITLVFGSIYSLATTPLIQGNSSSDGNTAWAVNNTVENATNNTSNNTANNTNNSVGSSIVGSAVSNNTANNTTNNTANNTSNNTSTNSSKLPYAGTNSSIVFVVIALAVSALYAYKKVSDYNV